MKKFIIFILASLSFGKGWGEAYSQNLVPNPGFETIDTCWLVPWGINYGQVPPWDSPTKGTPDGYNVCSPILNTSVPSNLFGYQNPRSGNGYTGAGFYGFTNSFFCSDYYVEYIQVELDSPLVAQEHYCASFYLNHANISKYALKNIGLYFSDTSFHDTSLSANLNFTPQIVDTNFVSDDSLWTLVYGQYQALGGERYIIIGNFKTCSTTDTLSTHPGNGGYGAYYYIDDVNVHCCTCDSSSSWHSGTNEIEKDFVFEIMPNPAENELRIINYELGIKEVAIYNMIGECVYKSEITNPQYEISVDVSHFAQGVYIVEARNEKGVMRKKFVKE